MGLSLGSVLDTVFPGLGGVAETSGGGARGSVLGAIGASAFGLDPQIGAALGSGISQSLDGGGGSGWEGDGTIYGEGGDVTLPGAGGPLAALSGVAAAIVALAMRLGGRVNVNSASSVLGYGRKVWDTLASWAAKNPSVNLVSLLVTLGLTAEQATQFIAWGATRKKKRRSRGISGRDLRTARRTMRKIVRMYQSLPHRSSSHRSSPVARTSIVQAR